MLKMTAFLITEGGDLLIGVADDGAIVGIECDQFESDDQFMLHLAQVVRNGLGDRAGTCIDAKTQVVQGKTVCVVSCQRSPEPVFLKWKGMEAAADGDFFVRSGPGTVKLAPDSVREYIRTRFDSATASAGRAPTVSGCCSMEMRDEQSAYRASAGTDVAVRCAAPACDGRSQRAAR